jgi:hypothetical protein
LKLKRLAQFPLYSLFNKKKVNMNTPTKILPLALGIILLGACKKDNKPTMINVSLTTSSLLGTSGQAVLLLSDDHRTTVDYVSSGMTDADGKISFNVTPGKKYYLYNGNFGLVNANAAYIITGKFTSQQQIDSSPVQTPAAQIGDNIEMDINGDGIVRLNEKVIPVTAPAKGNTTQVSATINGQIAR